MTHESLFSLKINPACLWYPSTPHVLPSATIDRAHLVWNPLRVPSPPARVQVDTSLELSDNAFALVCAGKLSPQHAFMTGRLVVRGDMLKAMRCGPLFELLRPPSILSGRQRASAPRDKTQADPGNNDRMDRSTNYLASPLARL